MKFTRVLLALLALAAPALAHEFKRDGDVGALLHIEPDDNPVAGKPVLAWFEASRRGERLTVATCECTVSLYRGAFKPGAKPVLLVAAKEGAAGKSKGKLSAAIAFPEEGAYTLVLEGKPPEGADFKPFRLEWVVRAGSEGAHGHG